MDECEKGISPKSRVNGTKADVLRRVFAEAGAGARDFSPGGGSTTESDISAKELRWFAFYVAVKSRPTKDPKKLTIALISFLAYPALAPAR